MRIATPLAACAALLSLVGPAASHGGVYRGPGTTVPPGAGGTTGAPGGGAGSPTTGGPRGAGPSLAWEVWWAFNQDRFLDLKAFVHVDSTRSEDGAFYLGRGATSQPLDLRPTDEQLYGRVVPALVAALEQEESKDVRTAALVALAKIGERPGPDAPEGSTRMVDHIRPHLTSPNQEVAETAALALGILASDGSAIVLADLVGDTEAGRTLRGGKRVSARTRAFAAYGLGLVGRASQRPEVRRFAVHKLWNALERDDTASADLGVAAVISLGLVPLPWAGTALDFAAESAPASITTSRESQLALLAAVLDDPQRDFRVRAHVPGALARLAEGASEEQRRALLAHLLPGIRQHTRLERPIREGLVLGVSALANAGDAEPDAAARRELERIAEKQDLLERRFALLGLGRLGARDAADGTGATGRAELERFLRDRLARSNGTLRPWVSLSLALMERGRLQATGRPAGDEGAALLRAALRDATSLDEAGGHCIALGLLGDPAATPLLVERFESWSVDSARGHAAIGLGLLDATGATETLRAQLERSVYRPDLIRDTGIALALLRDKGAVPVLVRILRESTSLSAQAAAARALGTIGDTRAVDPLLELLADREATALARAFAAAALGIVGDKDPLPWSAAIAADVHYGAEVETLTNSAGSGVLDLL